MSTLLQDNPSVAGTNAPPQLLRPEPASAQGMGQKNTSRQTQRARSHEYLTFQLNGEAYGIDILKVQEIRSYEPPTKIANAPPHIKGIINLRGVIVSVVDLRIKFNEAQVHGDLPIDSTTVVIVLNVREHVIGVVVDAVCDVMQLSESAIQPAPDIRSSVMDTSYIVGIAKVNDRLLILMDIEALMSSPDMGLLGAMPSHSAE